MSEQESFEARFKELYPYDDISGFEKGIGLRLWNAATAESNKRIDALESEVAELKAELKSEKEHSNILLKNGGEFYRNELALKAHINTLREKLETALTSLRKYENGI